MEKKRKRRRRKPAGIKRMTTTIFDRLPMDLQAKFKKLGYKETM